MYIIEFASSYDDIREISNVGILVGVPYYQQSMLYALGGHTNLCERRLFTCPLVLGQNYTVPVTISLPNDNTKVVSIFSKNVSSKFSPLNFNRVNCTKLFGR